MNYENFTDTGLRMMHDAVHEAIAADSVAMKRGEPPPCRTSDTKDWRDHAEADHELALMHVICITILHCLLLFPKTCVPCWGAVLEIGRIWEGQRPMMDFLEDYQEAIASWVWFAIILFWLNGFSLFWLKASFDGRASQAMHQQRIGELD
jgi:hypothetical protein